MKKKKEVLRACMGCGERKPKQELIRIVRTPDGNFVIDETGKTPGRGAYLCKNKACLEKAKKTRKVERSFVQMFPPETYKEMEDALTKKKCRNLLTICRKAGKLEAGFARAKDAIQGGYAACILLTADLSEKSRKEVLYFAEKQHVPVVQTNWEMAEVRLLFGQRAGILTICETGFAQRIQALLQTESSSSNG